MQEVKETIRKVKWAALTAFLLIAGLSVLAASLQRVEKESAVDAGNHCTMQSVGGTYSFAIFGTTLPGNPYSLPPGPYNAAGTITLDGFGNYTLSNISMKNGGPAAEETVTGTYTVNGCRIDFKLYDTIPVAVMYATNSLQNTQGVSILEGTNWTYLGTRK